MIRLRPSGVDEILIKRVQDWYEPGPGVFITSTSTLFSPAMLFTGTTTGAWYDPSDTTTLFQGAAGTQPVTAVEQPVGLMLDKRDTAYSTYFDGAGDYLSTPNNSAFDFGTGDFTIEGWVYLTGYSASYTSNYAAAVISKDKTTGSANDRSWWINIGGTSSSWTNIIYTQVVGSTYIGAARSYSFALNTWYHIAVSRSSGVVKIFVNGSQVGADQTISTSPNTNTTSIYVGQQGYTGFEYYFPGYISNLRVVKGTALYTANFTPPATPLTAVTGTSLLTCGTTWSGNPAITTAGNARADKLNPFKAGTGNHALNSSGNSANFPVLSARYNQYLSTETLATQNVTTVAASYKLAFTGTGSITLSGTATGTYSAGTHTITCTSGTLTSTVSGTVTQADLRVANDALNQPAYQRVNTATDYDTVGFKPYLRFNGTNQWLQTNSIDFTSTDKMFVSAGVRKLSDAATGIVAELSADLNANNGSFYLGAAFPSGANWRFAPKGTSIAGVTATTFAAPITNIVSGIGDISGDQAILRVNGTQAAISTADQGTGNYGNYPLYIGARAGTSLWFNGRLYGMVVAGKQASAAEITSTETYLNQKTGAY